MGGLLLVLGAVSGGVPESREYMSVLPFEMAGALDLAGLAVATWTLWGFLSLPLQGLLRRGFRFISLGALAFALTHVLDSLIGALGVLSTRGGILLAQGEVLFSVLLFVPGMAGLAESFAQVSDRENRSRSLLIWSLAVGFMIGIAALSFILYGISPEAEVIAFWGINACLIILAVICCWLLIRARIRGAVGFSLWLAMLGLILFVLAHPLQAWMAFQPSESSYGPVVHRLLVIPALCLFALSMTHLARRLTSPPLPRPMTLSEMTRPHVVPLVRITKPATQGKKEALRALPSSRR